MASEAQLYYLRLKIRPNCLKFKNIRLDECEKVVLITIVSRLDLKKRFCNIEGIQTTLLLCTWQIRVRSLRNVSPLRKNFDRTGSLEFEKTFVQKKFLM
jgi:hypothetical protein